MPKITADLTKDPLFTDEDPLEITIPDVGTWRLSDYDVNPPDDAEINPEHRPVTYIVTMLAMMAWETPDDTEAGRTPNADDMADKLADALAGNVITLGDLGTLLGDITDAQRKAAKARASKASRRPTRGQRR